MRLKSGSLAALALDHHAAQHLLQVAARDAAQAAIAEQHGLVGAGAHQRVVDAGRAEFVHHHRGALAFRRRQERLSSVVLPAPRKPVITVTGTLAPRSRLSRRPKRPAAGEGNVAHYPAAVGGQKSISSM